jgi:hypothetical protein
LLLFAGGYSFLLVRTRSYSRVQGLSSRSGEHSPAALAPGKRVPSCARALPRAHPHRRVQLDICLAFPGGLDRQPRRTTRSSARRRQLGEPYAYSTSHDVRTVPHGSVPVADRCAATQRPASVKGQRHRSKGTASPHRLSFSPPSLRAQVSAARRVCGRVGIALRRRRAEYR